MSPPDSPASSNHEPDSGEENAARDLAGALERVGLNPDASAGDGTDSEDSSGSDQGELSAPHLAKRPQAEER